MCTIAELCVSRYLYSAFEYEFDISIIILPFESFSTLICLKVKAIEVKAVKEFYKIHIFLVLRLITIAIFLKQS